MAPFKALAGPSPNCWAVFVQMEHWAIAGPAINKKQNIRKYISNLFFITTLFEGKITYNSDWILIHSIISY